MTDQAASALTNLTPYAWILFTIAGALSAGLVAVGLLTFGVMLRDMAVIAVALARGTVRRRKLIAAVSKIDGARRPTRAMDLGGLVVSPHLERIAQEGAARCRWCRPSRELPWAEVARLTFADCTCDAECDSGGCIAGVRHG